MKELLQLAKLDAQFEYSVEKDGDIYVAGAKNCELFRGMIVFGDLFLDKLGKRDSRMWSPRLTNPFTTETRKKETRQSELCVPTVMVAHSGWKGESKYSLDAFIGSMERGILQK